VGKRIVNVHHDGAEIEVAPQRVTRILSLRHSESPLLDQFDNLHQFSASHPKFRDVLRDMIAKHVGQMRGPD
jgi:hypothetical protein